MRPWGVGAFDSYAADVACPTCGDLHHVSGQTKLFSPDYDEQRWFALGVALPADFVPADVARLARSAWVRIRPPTKDPDRFALLADFDELYPCHCGRWLGVLLHFALAPGRVTLERIELLDLREDVAAQVDYASADGLWPGDFARHAQRIARFDASPDAARAAWLRECARTHFAVFETVAGLVPIGPTQCEACGQVRERVHAFASLDGFFERSGLLYLGGRIPFDDRWLDADVDRRGYLRVRHPVAATTLTLLDARQRFSCGCGAGRSRLAARFARHPGALELVELTLRAVHGGAAELGDVDFLRARTRAEDGRGREALVALALT